jgi:CubicO group peptidase (beta-lactamase class C family)
MSGAAFEPLRDRIAALIAAGRLSGCSYAVGLGGNVISRGGFGATPPEAGESTLPPGSPVRADTIFITASVTKPLVGVAVMQLVEDGALDVDAPVATFIPGFRDVPSGPQAKAAVTVRHLLTHTSGVAESFGHPVSTIDRDEHPTLADHTAAICAAPLLFEPGANVSYSSAAYNLLADIVREVSGVPLPDFLRDRLFGPLSHGQ